MTCPGTGKELLQSSTSILYFSGFSNPGPVLGCWLCPRVGDTSPQGKCSSGADGWESLPGRMRAVTAEVAHLCFFPLLFPCLVCGKRYKNRPGLSYHYAHTHLASEEGDEAQDQETRSPPNHRNENHRREFPVVGLGQ